MPDQKLHITLLSHHEKRISEISKGIKSQEISTSLKVLSDCESLGKYLATSKWRYQIVMLDMDEPKDLGMECLRYLRSNPEFENIVIVIFLLEENKERETQAFIDGANICFTYPSSSAELKEVIKGIIRANWQIMVTGCDRNTMIFRF